LDVFIEPHHGTCHQVRSGVAEDVNIVIVFHGMNYSGLRRFGKYRRCNRKIAERGVSAKCPCSFTFAAR
jgi:hypothetical protein